MDFSDFLPKVDYSADNEDDPTADEIPTAKDKPLGMRTMTQVKKIRKRKET